MTTKSTPEPSAPMESAPSDDTDSPCTGHCDLVSRASGSFCRGCGRFCEAIAMWPDLSDEEKRLYNEWASITRYFMATTG